MAGESAASLALTGYEVFDVMGLEGNLVPGQEIMVLSRGEGGRETRFKIRCRIDDPVEVCYHRNGGILYTVLRDLVRPAS